MDTDDLSLEAYKGIIVEAERLTHDLTLHYGVLSYNCKDEAEYLKKAISLTEIILNLRDNELEDFFWGNPPKRERLNKTLKKILSNIESINSIPIGKRHFD